MLKFKSRIYEWLLKRYEASIKKSQLQGKEKILFLARELTGELDKQGYKLNTLNIDISLNIFEHGGKLDVKNIINGWSVKED